MLRMKLALQSTKRKVAQESVRNNLTLISVGDAFGTRTHASPLGTHVAAVKLPNTQCDALDNSYPDAHVGRHDEPCASDDVQFPTWPLLGAVDALHPDSNNQSQRGPAHERR